MLVTAGGRVLNVTALGPDAATRSGARIRCGRTDHLRRPADPHRHRRPSRRANDPGGLMPEAESSPTPAAGTELPDPGGPTRDDARRRGGLRGDRGRLAPGRDHHGVGQRQAEDAARRQGPRGGGHPLRGPRDERPPDARPGRRVLQGGADAGPEGDHRRCRDERRPPRRRRRPHQPAGDRRPDRSARTSAAWTRCSRSRRCHPASRSPAWPSTGPRTPGSTRRGSSSPW